MLISKFGSAEKSEIISFNPGLPKELVRFLECEIQLSRC